MLLCKRGYRRTPHEGGPRCPRLTFYELRAWRPHRRMACSVSCEAYDLTHQVSPTARCVTTYKSGGGFWGGGTSLSNLIQDRFRAFASGSGAFIRFARLTHGRPEPHLTLFCPTRQQRTAQVTSTSTSRPTARRVVLARASRGASFGGTLGRAGGHGRSS